MAIVPEIDRNNKTSPYVLIHEWKLVDESDATLLTKASSPGVTFVGVHRDADAEAALQGVIDLAVDYVQNLPPKQWKRQKYYIKDRMKAQGLFEQKFNCRYLNTAGCNVVIRMEANLYMKNVKVTWWSGGSAHMITPGIGGTFPKLEFHSNFSHVRCPQKDAKQDCLPLDLLEAIDNMVDELPTIKPKALLTNLKNLRSSPGRVPPTFNYDALRWSTYDTRIKNYVLGLKRRRAAKTVSAETKRPVEDLVAPCQKKTRTATQTSTVLPLSLTHPVGTAASGNVDVASGADVALINNHECERDGCRCKPKENNSKSPKKRNMTYDLIHEWKLVTPIEAGTATLATSDTKTTFILLGATVEIKTVFRDTIAKAIRYVQDLPPGQWKTSNNDEDTIEEDGMFETKFNCKYIHMAACNVIIKLEGNLYMKDVRLSWWTGGSAHLITPGWNGVFPSFQEHSIFTHVRCVLTNRFHGLPIAITEAMEKMICEVPKMKPKHVVENLKRMQVFPGGALMFQYDEDSWKRFDRRIKVYLFSKGNKIGKDDKVEPLLGGKMGEEENEDIGDNDFSEDNYTGAILPTELI